MCVPFLCEMIFLYFGIISRQKFLAVSKLIQNLIKKTILAKIWLRHWRHRRSVKGVFCQNLFLRQISKHFISIKNNRHLL